MQQFYEHRATAIRRFFGDLKESQWPLYKSNLWYVPSKKKCQAFEPSEREDDGYTVALAQDTIYRALFNKPLPTKD